MGGRAPLGKVHIVCEVVDHSQFILSIDRLTNFRTVSGASLDSCRHVEQGKRLASDMPRSTVEGRQATYSGPKKARAMEGIKIRWVCMRVRVS